MPLSDGTHHNSDNTPVSFPLHSNRRLRSRLGRCCIDPPGPTLCFVMITYSGTSNPEREIDSINADALLKMKFIIWRDVRTGHSPSLSTFGWSRSSFPDFVGNVPQLTISFQCRWIEELSNEEGSAPWHLFGVYCRVMWCCNVSSDLCGTSWMFGREPVHAVVALVQWLYLRLCWLEKLADVWGRAAWWNVEEMACVSS